MKLSSDFTQVSFGNLFSALPVSSTTKENFESLLERPGLRIERIVSTGQASPPGFWYDQPEDEWVVLLSGAAGLRFADEESIRELKPGDWLHIPAHVRHRVEWTDAATPSVWLAVHFTSPDRSALRRPAVSPSRCSGRDP